MEGLLDPSYRHLPGVDVLLEHSLLEGLPRAAVRAAAREVLDELRAAIRGEELDTLPDVAVMVAERTGTLLSGRLRPVINATGVVVHTNLGRAPWHPDVVMAASEIAGGYCNLEIDLETGQRGGRMDGVTRLLRHLCGCEAALVVNNCAAAVLLALTAVASGRDVVVSRGELVEIGGSFRIPDVITAGGARLAEVGTTNRTHLKDYRDRITDDTAVLLRVHPSNFDMTGFTARPSREELVRLGRERGVLVVEDLGSGSLLGENGEPGVRSAIEAGVDLVLFSGDKLLGGPQAGLIVGRAEVVERLRRHPIYRAMRVGKVTLSAVEATLVLHMHGVHPPVMSMIEATADELEKRAQDLSSVLEQHDVAHSVQGGEGVVGGGSSPARRLVSRVVVVSAPNPNGVARALRNGSPAIVVRVADDTLRIDVRTLRDSDVFVVGTRLASVLQGVNLGK